MKYIEKILNGDQKEVHFKIESIFNEKKRRIPDRYRIKRTQEGDVLFCIETPNITVKIQRDFVVTLQEAKKFPERSIFLDGAAKGEPFLDNQRQIYNLDHHEDCERTFTLSTCEQALILIRKGLNLKDKNWFIYANEPDLDTIFAIWILLNHNYMNSGTSKQYKKIVPLIRLEGVIDALGLELIDITAFPQEQIKKYKNQLDKLRELELSLKSKNIWNTTNFVEYTHQILNLIDQIVFELEDLKNLKNVIEILRTDITDDDSVAVFEGELGIYELEEYLNKVYQSKPTFVILKKNHNTYTIRKSNIFSPLDLEKIYERLNIFDKNANSKENRWGGSNQIGGSPRITGTALTPSQIIEICKNAFYHPSRLDILKVLTFTLFISLLPNIISWLIISSAILYSNFLHLITLPLSIRIDVFYFLYFVVIFIFGYKYFYKNYFVLGFRVPVGFKWVAFFPFVLIVSFLGGIWLPKELLIDKNIYNFIVGSLLGSIASGVLFFSIIHSIFLFYFPVQRAEGVYFISKPSIFTSILYTLTTITLPFYHMDFPTLYEDWNSLILAIMRSPFVFLYALLLTFIKERAESVLPSLAIHTLLHILWGIIFVFFKN